MPIRKRQSNPMLCMRAAPAKVPLQARRVQANPPERDPVLEVVFNALKRMSRNGRVVTYAKLQFKFLDHIKQLKQRCQDDAILESTLMFLAVEQKHGNTHADSHNKPTARDTPNVKARYCIEQMRELERDTRAIRRKAMLVLTNAIASTGYHLPPALSAKHITDLCTILYAITSDSYYRRPYAIQVNSQSTISKVHVINSINVLGGTPSSFKLVDISDSLWTFGQDLRMALSSAHLSQPTRLGTLDKTAAEQGLWLWQASSSIDTLKTSHEHWQILDSATFNDLKALSQRRLVFLIHESHLTIPLLLHEKLLSNPAKWNDWSQLSRSTNPSLPLGPPAEFLPASGSATSLPGGHVVSIAFHPSAQTERKNRGMDLRFDVKKTKLGDVVDGEVEMGKVDREGGGVDEWDDVEMADGGGIGELCGMAADMMSGMCVSGA